MMKQTHKRARLPRRSNTVQQHAEAKVQAAAAVAAAPAPCSFLLTQHLSDDLLGRVLGFVGEWAVTRTLCHATRVLADRVLEGAVVQPQVPVDILRTLLGRVGPGLATLDLSGCAVLDDALLRHVVEEACPHLNRLLVNYCLQLTPAVTSVLLRVPHVALRGCWRLHRPCPSLPSEAVLELVLLALQQNDRHRHDGVAKHFEFASPANRVVDDEDEDGGGGSAQPHPPAHQQQQQHPGERRPLMDLRAFAGVVYERLQPLLGCASFSVRQLQYELPDRACFLVRIEGKKPTATVAHAPHYHHQHYLWLLSRQAEGQLKDCWMTDAIISAEHGLLSFLNLVLTADGGGGGGGGSGGGGRDRGVMVGGDCRVN